MKLIKRKFKIKISSTSFSQDYCIIKYTTNGIFWKSIKHYEYDVLDKWCYMTTEIIHFSNAKDFLSKFKTIEDVKKYEEKELLRVIGQNKEISERNKKHNAERNNVYKLYS